MSARRGGSLCGSWEEVGDCLLRECCGSVSGGGTAF